MPKKSKSLKERILKSIEIKERFGENPEFIVVELPYSAEHLRDIRPKKREKHLNKALGVLNSVGADKVVYTREVKEIFSITDIESKTYIPPKRICECVLYVSEKVSAENAFNSLVICDNRLEMVSYNNLANLCRNFRNISIATERTCDAEKICDMVFNEYGICIAVEKSGEKCSHSMRSILADVDAGMVRAGDFIINGLEFSVDVRDYDVHMLDITCAMLKTDNKSFKIKNYISGKNRLTMNE